MEYLFVYGTLMKEANHPLGNLIRHEGEFMGRALIKGKLFLIDYYPGVVHSTSTHDHVIGEVYALKNPTKVLAALDEYEEYDPFDNENSEFVRRKIHAKLDAGSKVSVWAYFYNLPTTGLKEILSGDFRSYLQMGVAH